jgi:hypothetical protein
MQIRKTKWLAALAALLFCAFQRTTAQTYLSDYANYRSFLGVMTQNQFFPPYADTTWQPSHPALTVSPYNNRPYFWNTTWWASPLFPGDSVTGLVGLATVGKTGNYADLLGAPTKVSAFTNDAGYITAAALDGLATVAHTGSYTDLLNAPTKVSTFNNDAGYITAAALDGLATVAHTGSYTDLLNAPTKVSAFTNDAGYITAAALDGLATVAHTGSYTDLLNAPTKVSAFTNDAGYLTSSTANGAYWPLTGINGAGNAYFIGTLDQSNLLVKTANTLSGSTGPSGPTLWGFRAGLNSADLNSTFVGYAAGLNTTGAGNTIVGNNALQVETTGRYNTMTGALAGLTQSGGSYNTYTGQSSGMDAQGSYNTAMGYTAMSRIHGTNNTAIGSYALPGDTSGSYNVALGYETGVSVTLGSNNTFLGAFADGKGVLSNATAIGYNARVSCNNCIAIGYAGTNVGVGVDSPTVNLDVSGKAAANYYKLKTIVPGSTGDMILTLNAVDSTIRAISYLQLPHGTYITCTDADYVVQPSDKFIILPPTTSERTLWLNSNNTANVLGRELWIRCGVTANGQWQTDGAGFVPTGATINSSQTFSLSITSYHLVWNGFGWVCFN